MFHRAEKYLFDKEKVKKAIEHMKDKLKYCVSSTNIDKDVVEMSIESLEKIEEIEKILKENQELKEQYKILEDGNKQILEEYKITFEEKLKYWKVITWIKGQYDDDFTTEEIQGLCERDKCIYESLDKIIKDS